jgi:diaminopropionate ammonia-lyase
VQILRNPHAHSAAELRFDASVPQTFHRRLDGYAPTALIEAPAAAARAGVQRVLVKYEVERFGLPAFKILGASWAVYRTLVDLLGTEPTWTSQADLAAAFAPLGRLTLVSATDGNHGRAVARAAQWFGMNSHILVPDDMVAARREAIVSEGAELTVIDGNYDAAVAAAAQLASESHVVISDTSWPGYNTVPPLISEGYGTIFSEIDQEITARSLDVPSTVFIPVGVGAFAKAAVAHYPLTPPDGPCRVAVEPVGADCLYQSLLTGEPTTVEGPQLSMMAGLNCANVSLTAWPSMKVGIDVATVIEDAAAAEAMQVLALDGLEAGETGAAAIGALFALADAGELSTVGLSPESTALCICTEGVTDPVNYQRIVGRPPTAR